MKADTQTAAPSPPKGQVQILKGEALDIPLGSKVLVEPRGMSGRFWCQFVGEIRGGFVILRLPPKDIGLREFLAADEEVTVRYLTGSKVCGFASASAGVAVKPLPLVFLRYPKTIQVLNLRRHERTNCLVPTTIYHEGKEAKGIIVNLSKGGCKLVLEPNADGGVLGVEQSAEIFFQFRILDMPEESYLKADVKNVQEEEDGLCLGLEFRDVPEDVQKVVTAYVDKAVQFDMI